MSTINGLPLLGDPPQEVIDAARVVRRWGDKKACGGQHWTIYGLQPAGSNSILQIALNALDLISSNRFDAAQLKRIAKFNAELIRCEMEPERTETEFQS